MEKPKAELFGQPILCEKYRCWAETKERQDPVHGDMVVEAGGIEAIVQSRGGMAAEGGAAGRDGKHCRRSGYAPGLRCGKSEMREK